MWSLAKTHNHSKLIWWWNLNVALRCWIQPLVLHMCTDRWHQYNQRFMPVTDYRSAIANTAFMGNSPHLTHIHRIVYKIHHRSVNSLTRLLACWTKRNLYWRHTIGFQLLMRSGGFNILWFLISRRISSHSVYREKKVLSRGTAPEWILNFFCKILKLLWLQTLPHFQTSKQRL